MRLLLLAFLLTAASCAAPPPAALSCPAERALYALRGEPGASLRLMQTPHRLNATSDLAARVEFEGDTYWFGFTSSLGFSRNYIGAIADPLEAARLEDAGEESESGELETDSSELVLFDADFDVIGAVPNSGDAAPAHLMANGIASSIWYSEPRRVLPLALWDLSGCADDV